MNYLIMIAYVLLVIVNKKLVIVGLESNSEIESDLEINILEIHTPFFSKNCRNCNKKNLN